MDLLAGIEKELMSLRESGSLKEALQIWIRERDALTSFRDSESLIAFLRDPDSGPRRGKDAALASVCLIAAGGERQAATLLIWLVLPGLLRVRQSLAGRGVLSAQDLDAELIAGLWEAATRVGVGTPSVSVRLLNGARWRALAAIREAIDWEKRSEPLSTEIADPPEPEVREGGLPDILAEAVQLRIVSEGQARLILASRLTIREVASDLGITLCAAQRRRRRAKLRLVAWLGESSRIPPRPLASEPPRNLPQNSQASPGHLRPSHPPL